MSFHVPEKLRVSPKDHDRLGTDASYGNNGLFIIRAGLRRPYEICCIASDGADWDSTGFAPPPWEHVSVSTPVRCPTWDEMCYVKKIFWDGEDTVIQFHPPESEYVNNHPYCLHLWRPVGMEILRPPALTVGVLA